MIEAVGYSRRGARQGKVECGDCRPASNTGQMASDDDERRSGLADAAGRAAFFPARAAARAGRGPIEEAVDEVLSAPEIARVVDRALAGSLPEEIARSIVRNRVLERIASNSLQAVSWSAS